MIRLHAHRRSRLPALRRAAPPPARGLACPLCGSGVLDDDAIGLLGDEIAHAECALVHWLRGEAHDGLQELVQALALQEQDGARRSQSQRG